MFGVATDMVKHLAGMPVNIYDARVDVLIGAFVPALRRAFDPAALEDETLHPILNLGAAELVAAEMLGILAREDGRRDAITIGDLRLDPHPDDGLALRDQGAARLTPFLSPGPLGRSIVGRIGSKKGTDQ